MTDKLIKINGNLFFCGGEVDLQDLSLYIDGRLVIESGSLTCGEFTVTDCFDVLHGGSVTTRGTNDDQIDPEQKAEKLKELLQYSTITEYTKKKTLRYVQ